MTLIYIEGQRANIMTEAVDNKPTLLVVDDSRLMRVAARKILKDEFAILEASDGEEAWDVLQASPQVSLVMSDLSMPNLDGLGLLARIRQSDSANLQNLPVIIVTGAEDDDGSKSKALAAGASDFITKPFESVQLLARAKTHAKQQLTQQALQNSEAHKEKLEAESSKDPLTGLENQRAFANHVAESLSYAARHHTELALILVQIEKYKVMFLRKGKKTAEETLRQTAELLSRERRREDKIARIGIDTFALLLPSANAIGAHRVAENLHQSLQSHDFRVDDEAVSVRSSLAVSFVPVDHRIDADTLTGDATAKLKQAIESGGNCIRHDEDLVANSIDNDTAANQSVTEKPLVATSVDVENALQALTHQRPTGQDSAALARAVLPLLQAWSRANGGICTTQLEDIRNALGTESSAETEELASAPA